jgi:hypothetical protein
MPYRLVAFRAGLVQVAVTGHIETDDIVAIREEGELMLRHIVEPFDTIVDATEFTGLNPMALAELRSLPIPPHVRAVAVILGGWQLLASKALPSIDGLVFVGSVEEAHIALAETPALALPRAEMSGAPTPAAADDPLPQVRRLPTRPLPAAHRPAPHRPTSHQRAERRGGLLSGLTGQISRLSRGLERLGGSRPGR